MPKAPSRPRIAHAPERQLTVKVPSRYWAADSPLDGISLAVWVGLLHLARRTEERARVRDSHGDSHASLERDSHALIERGDVYPAQSIRDANMQPLTLAAIARFVKLPRHQVQHAMHQLEAADEIAKSLDGAYVLTEYKIAQECPGTERKRRQRARKKRDSHGDSHAASERDSHGDSHASPRDSHALARAFSDLKELEESKIYSETTTTLETPKERAHAQAVEAAPGSLSRVRARKPRPPKQLGIPGADAHPKHMPPATPERGAEYRGYSWLNAIFARFDSVAPGQPSHGSRVRAYLWLGTRPDHELQSVGEFIIRHLEDGALSVTTLTPEHLIDHWPRYLGGVLPFRIVKPTARVVETLDDVEAQRAELARAAAAYRPSWLTDHSDGTQGAT